jgi:serine O-acetyltransferase
MPLLARCPKVAGDCSRITRGVPSLAKLAYWYLSNPGFRAVLLYRCAHTLYSHRWRRLAACITSLCVSSTGCEIRPEAEVGPGLLLPHPVGIVIGCGVRMGARCTILQNVTIGERYSPPGDHSYPTIGDDVTIGAGAVVLGAISIDSGAMIGANSVVLANVPSRAVVVGAPARAIAALK